MQTAVYILNLLSAIVITWSLVPYGLEKNVFVWDSIVSTRNLDFVRSVLNDGCSNHFLCDRDIPAMHPAPILLDQILRNLNDSSKYVEYWFREEWINLDAHRDVDEFLARYDGKLRCPNNGHILYFDIGSEALGPTAFFLEESKNSQVARINELVIVPAKAGRLTRFGGDMIHAVPRPTYAYLDPEDGGTNTEIWTRRRDQKDDRFRRSVLLFNTWDTPPQDVKLQEQNVEDPLESYIDTLKCNDFNNWLTVNINNYNSQDHDKYIQLKVGILGDNNRRFRQDTSMRLKVPDYVKFALGSTDEPARINAIELNI